MKPLPSSVVLHSQSDERLLAIAIGVTDSAALQLARRARTATAALVPWPQRD
jgi:hypothetical protein